MLSRNSGFLLGLAFAIFTGLAIARFSKPAEEKTNMIISAVSCYTILVMLQALRGFPLNSWTLLFTAGSFFLSLILMQTEHSKQPSAGKHLISGKPMLRPGNQFNVFLSG